MSLRISVELWLRHSLVRSDHSAILKFWNWEIGKLKRIQLLHRNR